MSGTRRDFLVGAGVVGTGLVIGLRLARRADSSGSGSAEPFVPNAFVRIAPDNTVTIVIPKSEMGQGVSTSLPMCLAEELDVDLQRVLVEFAPLGKDYIDPLLTIQGTGGSLSTVSTYQQMRTAGAAARALLLAAAAREWGVDVATLSSVDGHVIGGARRASYGSLASRAAEIARNAKPRASSAKLKPESEFKYLGKPMRRLDGAAKVTGRARFGIDVRVPQMLFAMVARPPAFGATVTSFSDDAARSVKGVVDVKRVPSGIAVLATDSWSARRGRDALKVEWDPGPHAGLTSRGIYGDYRRLAGTPGTLVKETGDVSRALAGAAKTLEAIYEAPYLAHACMEPMNAFAHVTPDHVQIRAGTQFQQQDAALVASALGMRPEQVSIETTFLGGGFGRRANKHSDFAVEAAQVSKAAGRAVLVVWTREDDMRAGYYRPLWVSRLRGGLDAHGMPVAWHHTIVGQSVIANSPMSAMAVNGIDPSSIEGSADMAWTVANHRVELHSPDPGVPVQWWRSVGHSYHGFAVNSFVDELAQLAGRDTLELRRALLADKPRHLRLLDLVAQKSGWGSPLPPGHGRGIALHESFGSIVAQVAEVQLEGEKLRVKRVVCAVDCGVVVNPLTIEAQMQGAVVFGLSAALRGEIVIEGGRAVPGNFDGYPVLRMDEMPQVEVHVAPSGAAIGGIGEPGVPPVAPAVCGAIFAASGRRIRRLPILASLASTEA